MPINGLLQQGNIDLNNRPRVQNPDGSISTVRSTSVNLDGKEVLLPTVSDDGRILSVPEAVQQYKQTGKHLGIFADPNTATQYAQQLHNDQAELIKTPPKSSSKTLTPEELEQVRQANPQFDPRKKKLLVEFFPGLYTTSDPSQKTHFEQQILDARKKALFHLQGGQ